MTDNTSALQRMLFPTVALVAFQSVSPKEEKVGQILVVGTSDSRSLNQKRQASGAVSNESKYEDISKSLNKVLSEFLQADLFAKKITLRLATKESNSDLNIDLCDWTKRAELLYKNLYCTYPRLRLFGEKSWRNTMMTPLLITWLPRKHTIHSATNTSGPTGSNKWTRTVLPAWFVKEPKWSVGSNQGSFSLLLSQRRYKTFSPWTLLLGYQKVSNTEVFMTWFLYPTAHKWQKRN